MWEPCLINLSFLSAVMSAGLGIVFWMTLKQLGTLDADSQIRSAEPTISVIVPARNEQLDLASAVRSILAQQDVRLQVILVNDHSSDDTGAIADSLARSDDRVTVIHDPPLRDGWLGKTNAMQTGISLATGALTVFTDADVIHHPCCFAVAVAMLEEKKLDLLSLCPTFECKSFWENVLLPHCFIAGTVQFCLQSVNDPRSSNGAAAGAFILVRREMVDRIDGMQSVRSEFLDDVALARSVKRHGGEARFQLAPNC